MEVWYNGEKRKGGEAMKKTVCLVLSLVFVCSFVLTACLFTAHTCDACECLVCEMFREQDGCTDDTLNTDTERSFLREETETRPASALLPAETPAKRKDKLMN